MNLPFTIEQFLHVFEAYNQAIWPAQIVAYVLGIICVIFTFKQSRYAHKIISGILAIFWLWMGGMYHIVYFSSINKPAYLFGVLFIVEGLLLFWFGVLARRLFFRFQGNASAFVGSVLVVYGMVIYPLLGYYWGHAYPKAPIFGVAPCPTTIFTFGLFLWSDRKIPFIVIVIPFIWSLIGFTAALFLGIKEDVGLLVAGILGTTLIIATNRKKSGLEEREV